MLATTCEQVTLHAAGRTDAGVHALAMRAHVDIAKPIDAFRLMEALNARLRCAPDPAYGRSYMEHLQALRADAAIGAELSDAASRLLAVPTTQQLVTLGPKGDTTAADLARRIVEQVRAELRHRGAAAD